jgi:hypothetical protein
VYGFSWRSIQAPVEGKAAGIGIPPSNPLVADQMLGKDSGKIKKLAKASITLSLPV